jgi:hypothetical protein
MAASEIDAAIFAFSSTLQLSGAGQIEPAVHRHHFEKSAEPIYGDHMETAI